MTASDGDLIGDEAVEAYRAAAVEACGNEFCACDEALRAGLAAALPWLAATIRAGVAEEIATAISTAFEPTGPIDVTIAYNHAAHLAWQLRVPDCGDQYHGADGGPCSGCGFDVAAPADALTASQPDRGTSDGAPGGSSRGSVALSGLQGHSAPTSNPTDTTQED